MKRRKLTRKKMKSYRIMYYTEADQNDCTNGNEEILMNETMEKNDVENGCVDEVKIEELQQGENISEVNVKKAKENTLKKRWEARRQRRAKKRLKISILTALMIGLLVGVYFAGSFYFDNHFYYNTRIAGLHCGGMTVEAVEKKLVERDRFVITIVTKEKKHTVDFGKMNAKYVVSNNVKDMMKKQKNKNWIVGCVEKTEVEAMTTLSYEEEELKKYIESLDFLDDQKVTKPINAKVVKTKGSYEVVEEVEGNQIDKNKLYSLIIKAIKEKKNTVNLLDEDCYVRPAITKTSDQIMNLKKKLVKYQNTTVTYEFGEQKEVLDETQIWSWVIISDNYTVTFNKDKISEYVKQLAKKYDTVGTTRTFLSTEGREVKVGGGSYGWKIDQKKEVEALMKTIQKGGSQKREPIYAQKAFARGANDIGNTYIEIDLGRQKMYYYEKGVRRVSTDIVSGNMAEGHATPDGVFMVIQKARNRTLRGADYESFVNYWLRVDGGVGIHDASWRSRYGGTIYKRGGSHGCINTPFVKVRELYSLVEMYTPIICFY